MLRRTWILALFILLIGACPRAQTAGALTEADTSAEAGLAQLSWDGSELHLGPAQLAGPPSGKSYRPYQIFSAQTALIVTALLDRLAVCSYVLQPDNSAAQAITARPYPGFLPQELAQGRAALVSLPDPTSGVSGGLFLLDRDGAEVWSNGPEQAQLLLPARAAPDAPLGVLRWQAADAVFPYGSSAEFVLFDWQDAMPVEKVLQLELSAAAAGVELLAASPSHGLLLVQHDFQSYEFIALSYEPLAIAGRWPLSGQPVTYLVYPGPGYDYGGLEIEGEAASLIVYEGASEGVVETWTFDMASGQVTRTAYLDAMPQPLDAENRLDLPDAAGAPYPQGILPSQRMDSWSIPAVLDAAGRCLVVESDGSTAWMAP